MNGLVFCNLCWAHAFILLSNGYFGSCRSIDFTFLILVHAYSKPYLRSLNESNMYIKHVFSIIIVKLYLKDHLQYYDLFGVYY